MEVVASLSQGRTAAAQCGLFTYKSVYIQIRLVMHGNSNIKLEESYTVLLYFTLCTVTCSHTELLNDIDNTCYGLMFKPY